jgi:hypothetical protein
MHNMVYRLLEELDKLAMELEHEKTINKRLERQMEYLITQLEVYQANKVTKFDPYI